MDERGRSRRAVLRTLGTVGLGGVVGRAAAQERNAESRVDDWLADTGNYDGTIQDLRGRGAVSVLVGAQGNGGDFAFEPPAIRISPGTAVRWVWTGQGGQHSAVAASGADFESELTAEGGAEFTHEFQQAAALAQTTDERVVTYFCEPHRALGMKGALVVDGAAVTTEPPETTRRRPDESTATPSEQTTDRGADGGEPRGWSQYQYGLANTGSVPESGTPTDGVTEAWRLQTEEQVVSSPVAVGGTVYAVDGDGHVYAVDAGDGSQRWRRRVASSAAGSSPAVVGSPSAGRTVYVGAGSAIHALSATDGDEVWRTDIDGRVESSPAVVGVPGAPGSGAATSEGGTVYVGSLAGAGSVYALDATDGSERWRAPMAGSVRSSPAVVPAGTASAVTDGGSVYVGSTEDRLSAFGAADGSLRWRAETAGGVVSSPAVVDGTVYVAGFDGALHAFDATDGSNLWTTQLTGSTESSPTVVGDTVYAGDSESVYAFDAADGTERWRTAIGNESHSPVVTDDVVYVTGWDDTVYALSADDGREQWRFHAGWRPTIGGGSRHLYISCGGFGEFGENSGWLVALAPNPGQTVGAMGVRIPETDLHVSERNVGIGAAALFATSAVTAKGITALHGRTGRDDNGHTLEDGLDTDAGRQNGPDPRSGTGEAFDEVVLTVSGVDEVTARRLAAAGYGSLAAVAAASESELAAIDGISAPLAARITADLEDAVDREGPGGAREGPAGDDTADTDPAAGQADAAAAATGSEPGGDDEQFEPATTPAGAFAADSDAFEGARTVAADGLVHVYDGRFVDDVGTEDARVYALSPDHADDGSAREAFREAARAWGSIGKNTHVATVYERGDDPRPWVAFDPGVGLLETHLETLDSETRFDLALDLTEAVRTAGMYNVVHGDLTPAVVFLDEDDMNGRVATVADWGLQRAVHETVAGRPGPTPYTAPEQLAGEPADDRTDVYRLGALVYRVLTGEHPFDSAGGLRTAIREGDLTPPTDHDPTLPSGVDDVLREAMRPDPDQRADSPYAVSQRLAATR